MAQLAHGTRVEHSQTSLMASFRMKLLARHRENVHLNCRNDFSDEPTEHRAPAQPRRQALRHGMMRQQQTASTARRGGRDNSRVPPERDLKKEAQARSAKADEESEYESEAEAELE